jgi:DhnA family fructose-bisphosphate aldolase class Ia
MADANPITMSLFLTELKKKVSDANAKLLLHTAVVRAGIQYPQDEPLKKEDAHILCMELIKSGGPGFHVGRTVYQQIRQ